MSFPVSPVDPHPGRGAQFLRSCDVMRTSLSSWCALALIAGCALAGLPLHAQEVTSASPTARSTRDTTRLTIEEARGVALRNNPDLSATRLEVDIARGLRRQAGILRFNPSADILASGASGTASDLSLGQELEVAGQRGVRRAVAQAGVSRATFSVANAERTTLVDVDRGFYRVVTADRRAELAQEVLALNERLALVASRQLREGEISKLDFNLSIIERGRARARAFAARREQQQSAIELRRLIGIPETVAVRAVFDSTVHRHTAVDSAGAQRMDLSAFAVRADMTTQDMIALALAQRPDLAERDAAIAQADADVTLARREALPNLIARVVSEQNASGTGRAIRPGVGLTIPLFNRNQGEIDARRAFARQVALDRAATAARVRADVEAALRAYQAAAGAIEVLETTVLGPARENRRLLEFAYREGKVGLAVLLLIRNQVIDAEQEYWTAWLAEREAAAELRAALGSPPAGVRTP